MTNEKKILAKIDTQKRPSSFFQVKREPTEHQKQFIRNHYPAYTDPEEMVIVVLDWLFERAFKIEAIEAKRREDLIEQEEET